MAIDEIKKYENVHGFYSWFMCRVSSHVIDLLDKLRISTPPNTITMLSLIFGVFFGVTLLYYDNQIMAAVFITLAYFCDNFDGIYARYKKKTSVFGAIFDPFVDRINTIIFYFALGVYGYLHFNNVLFILAPGVLFALSHITHEFKYYFEKYKVENPKFEQPGMSIWKKIVAEVFAIDKFVLALSVFLIIGLNEFLLGWLFVYEIVKRVLWVVRTLMTMRRSHKIG